MEGGLFGKEKRDAVAKPNKKKQKKNVKAFITEDGLFEKEKRDTVAKPNLKKDWKKDWLWDANKYRFANSNADFKFAKESVEMRAIDSETGEFRRNPSASVRKYKPEEITPGKPYPYLVDAPGMGYLNVENLEQACAVFYMCCEIAIKRAK